MADSEHDHAPDAVPEPPPDDAAADDAAADDAAAFERLLVERPRDVYVLQLFVSGLSPRSTAAIRTLRGLCERHLPGRYTLDITDIYAQPALARAQQILASPTLVRHRPLPVRRMVGDLSNVDLVLRTLDLA